MMYFWKYCRNVIHSLTIYELLITFFMFCLFYLNVLSDSAFFASIIRWNYLSTLTINIFKNGINSQFGSESLQQKLNIEQSAHSIVPLAAWWRGAGWRWWDMFAAIHLSYFHPHCEQGTEPESGSRPAASCQAAAGGQDQSCGQQQHNHKIATTRYCLQHSQHRNTAHHD